MRGHGQSAPAIGPENHRDGGPSRGRCSSLAQSYPLCAYRSGFVFVLSSSSLSLCLSDSLSPLSPYLWRRSGLGGGDASTTLHYIE